MSAISTNSPSEPAPPRVPEGRAVLWIALALAAVVIAVFSGVADCDFIQLDDSSHVYENAVVRGGLTWPGLRTAFTTPHASLWVPLTTSSFMADVSLFGLNPRAFHLENVAWHAAAVVLLFLALRRMTGRLWPSALVAALFGLHPINVESVAWITERKNVLCAFFTMLTMLAWSYYAVRSRVWSWLAALVAFALALLAKPMAVTLPCVLLLFDAWPLRRGMALPWWRLIVEKLPFFALSFAASRMTTWATGPRAALVSLDTLPFPIRLTNALTSCAAYLGQLVCPRDFAVIYPHPMAAHWPPALAALALLLAITGLAIYVRRTQPWLLVGWLLFLGMLVPALGFVQVGSQARADRFTYLAQIGLFIALVWSADHFWPESARRLRAPVAAALLITLAALTAAQIRVWTDSETLFEHSLAVTGPNPQMLDLAGSAHARRGDEETAIRYWRQSLSLMPDGPVAREALTQALAKHRAVDPRPVAEEKSN